MKAVSIKQPWANMIADGEKTIETRTWKTSYRGPLLIVSSKKPDLTMLPQTSNRKLNALVMAEHGPYGYAVAVARLTGCRPMQPDDTVATACCCYPGAIAWLLKDTRRIKPFPVKGSLGLYDVDDALIKVLETKGEKG